MDLDEMDPVDALPGREVVVTSCASCAFRPGTVANLDGWNRIKIAACLMGGGDFRCHENTRRRCRGFSIAEGCAPEPSEWKSRLAEHVCTMMTLAEENPEDGERLFNEMVELLKAEGAGKTFSRG